jgi:ubiquinone/menaquinone biosynthesis C-methylase UbiE
MTNIRRPYFNNLAAEWDHLPGPPNVEDKVRNFVRRSDAGAASRILDVGCGTGILLPYLLDLYPAASCLVELDLAEHMLQVNSAKYHGNGIGHVCADAEILPFMDSCFDLVLCFGVFPHFEDKTAAIRQMFNALASGGIWCLGHHMGRRELNEFHSRLPAPVSGDSLPPAEVLAKLLLETGMKDISTEDNANGYFVRAVKP